MTKTALLFPPQWDPRQPSYSIPALGGFLKSKGFDAKGWDLNVSLYDRLLTSDLADTETSTLLKEYLDPDILKNPGQFSETSCLLETILYDKYDSTEYHRLYWDYLNSGLSPNNSKDWKLAIDSPAIFPFYSILKNNIDEIVRYKPNVIGISAISDTQILATLALSSILREKLPDAKIIIGGHAFEERKKLIVTQKWLFKTIDLVCVAEGEPALLALVLNKEFNEIPNVLWFDGKKVRYPDLYQDYDLESAGFVDFSLVPLDTYLSPEIVIPLKTAYGCPWNRCTFCNRQQGINLYRSKSVAAIIDEMKHHIAKGYTNFFFIDDAIIYKNFKELSLAILNMNLEVRWICYARFEEKFDVETFQTAYRAGCRKIFFGLETASERLLKLYRKGIRPATAKKIIKDASIAGLSIHLFIICAFPDETVNDRESTYQFLQDVISFINPFGFTYDVFPLSCSYDSEIYNNPSKYGASGISIIDAQDLTVRYYLEPYEISRSNFKEFKNKVNAIIEESLNHSSGLRHLNVTQDSNHLLLLDK